MKSAALTKDNFFKKCSNCTHKWKHRDTFLSDNALEIIGYQVDFRDVTEGLFLFNHSCGSTIAVKAQFFIDLYDGPIFRERLTGSKECSGYCQVRDNLLSCNSKCECSYVREIIQIIKRWPKKSE